MEPRISYPELVSFKEPVSIKCQVAGKKLMAEVIGTIDNSIQFIFVIQFSDGVCIQATMVEEGYWSVDNVKYKSYLLAIGDSLKDFLMVMHDDWYKFEIENRGKKLLVWVAADGENKDQYSIYFQGDYQFHLRRTKSGWENQSIRMGAKPVDPYIVSLVVKELQQKLI